VERFLKDTIKSHANKEAAAQGTTASSRNQNPQNQLKFPNSPNS